MNKENINNAKLGIFLIAGLLVLVFTLYMIGKDQNLFTSNFRLKARFRDIAGLMPGNNVRYSGIQNGTVKSIDILNDTTIEVTMYVSKTTRAYIRKTSLATIGTEGLMGNKVINIAPGDPHSPLAVEDDILPTSNQGDLRDAMGTLYETNDNAAIIAAELVHTVQGINRSPALWSILNDSSLPADIHTSLVNFREASNRLNRSAETLEAIINDVHQGNGIAGMLLADKGAREKTEKALANFQMSTEEALAFMTRLNAMSADLQIDLNQKNGLVNTLLKDTAVSGQLYRSINNIASGTAAFNEDMEALKHNFLLRGYFKRLARKNRINN